MHLHITVITLLSSLPSLPQAAVQQRQERVSELEALLAEVSSSRDALRRSLGEYEGTIQRLEEELRETQEQHQLACSEVGGERGGGRGDRYYVVRRSVYPLNPQGYHSYHGVR